MKISRRDRVIANDDYLTEVEKILRSADTFEKNGKLDEKPRGTSTWREIFAANAVTYIGRFMVVKFKLELDGSPLSPEIQKRYDEALPRVISRINSAMELKKASK